MQSQSRPWAVGENYFISWLSSGEHLVCDLFEGHVGTLLPRGFPGQGHARYRENGWFDYLVLNCIAVKKCEIFESAVTKMEGHHMEEHKKYL